MEKGFLNKILIQLVLLAIILSVQSQVFSQPLESSGEKTVELSQKEDIETRRLVERCEEKIRYDFASGNYEECLKECDELNKLDPGNAVARLYFMLAQEKKERLAFEQEAGTSPTLVLPVATPAIMPTPTLQISAEPSPPLPPAEKAGVGKRIRELLGSLRLPQPMILTIFGALILIVAGPFLIIRWRKSAAIKATLAEVESKLREAMPPPEKKPPPKIKKRPAVVESGAGRQIAEVVEALEEEPAEVGVAEEEREIIPEKIAAAPETVREKKTTLPVEPSLIILPELKQEGVAVEEKREEKPAELIKAPIPPKEALSAPAEEIIIEPALSAEEMEVKEEETIPLEELDKLLEEGEKGTAKEETADERTKFGKEYDRYVFSDAGQEETIISREAAYEETIVDQEKKIMKPTETELPPAKPPIKEEETIILTPEALEEETKKIEAEPEAKKEFESREKPAEEEEIFEKIDLRRFAEVKPEEEFPGEEIKGAKPEKIEQRQETLFQDQFRRGCEAIEKGEWKKAIHYLTIARALRPEDEKTKEKLNYARSQRHKEQQK